jgi:phosphoesterase RecJ-like protein
LADFNKLDRCGEVAPYIDKLVVPRVVIDHHPFPDPELGEVMFCDTSVSSTCELSFHILQALGWTRWIDRNAAACFYSGIITDTGSLSYNSSDPQTYRAVAELVGLGIDKDFIHKELFQSNSLSRTQLLGHVLCNKLEVLNGYGAAFISLSKEELDAHDYVPGDTEGFVNYPLTIQGIGISALFTEREKDKMVRISFRSRCEVPVNMFAEQYFSGGGHANAAGGEWQGPLTEAVERFRNFLPLYLENFKKENNRK